MHDHLFFPRYAAFNLTCRQEPVRQIYSMVPPRRGWLTRPGMANWQGSHAEAYEPMLDALVVGADKDGSAAAKGSRRDGV